VAKFKDPVLKQIVNELAFQNPEAPVLAPEAIALSNVVADATGAPATNTRAHVTIAAPGVDYPAGMMTVHYRRLELDTLVGEASTALSFTGVAEQAVTLEDLLKKLVPNAYAYVLPELVDEGPYDLTRDALPLTLTPKATSQVLTPTPFAFTAQTAAIDLSTFAVTAGLTPFTSTPFPTYGSDVQSFILTRIATANGHPEHPLLAQDVTIERLPTTDLTFQLQRRRIRVTVTNPSIVYKGTGEFTYDLYAASGIAQFQNIAYTEGLTQAQTLDALSQTANRWFDASELEPLPVRPVRQSDYTSGDATQLLTVPDSWVYGSGYLSLPSGLPFHSTALYPFEEIIRFQVLTVGKKRLYITTNTGTMPVTIELLEKPAAFAPAVLTVNSTGTTLEDLPVGTYKIRLTRADSYRTPLRHRDFNASNPAEIKVTEIFKVKGHDLTNMFQYCQELTTVHPGAFDESTYTYKAPQLFYNCTALASLPDNILHPFTRCWDLSSMFSACTSLTTVPDDLFGFIKAYKPNISDLFRNSGLQVVPTNLFQDVRWIVFTNLFRDATALQTISPGFIAAMNLDGVASRFDGMFYNNVALQAIPADLFVGVPQLGSWLTDAYYGDWNVANMFYNCTSLTAIPANLFQPFRDSGYNSIGMQNTFYQCTGITALPGTLLTGLRFGGYGPGLMGTFYGCTSLTSLPSDLFVGVDLDGALGTATSGYNAGTFQASGLTSIPADLFATNTNLKGAIYTFCDTDITAVPAGFFENNPQLQTVESTFQSCALLATVPSALFGNCPLIESTQRTFSYCAALTSVPANLLTPLVNLETARSMFEHTGLTAIPAGFLATNAALTDAYGLFDGTQLTGMLDNVFTNQPLLTMADYVFRATPITGVGANVFSAAPELVTILSAFQSCTSLATVHADLLKYQVKLQNVSFLFYQTAALTTVPATLFTRCTELTNAAYALGYSAGLTSIPAGLLSANTKLTNLSGLCSNCTSLAAIPAGLFTGLTEVITVASAFQGCSLVPSVPNQLFKSFTKCAAYTSCFEDCTGLSMIGVDLFGETTVDTSIESMFETSGVTVVPDGIFFALKNITRAHFVFLKCWSLVTVGRLIYNTMAVKIEIGGILGGDLVGTGPDPYPDFTVADNVIDSSIQVNIGAYGRILPFHRRNLWTKNIDNLLGANCKFQIATNESKDYFANKLITGSGNAFITKHAVATTNTGFFKNSTGLSDYATLPAWAKT
jgi:hypothetical protein